MYTMMKVAAPSSPIIENIVSGFVWLASLHDLNYFPENKV
jgi:hypothetical protein